MVKVSLLTLMAMFTLAGGDLGRKKVLVLILTFNLKQNQKGNGKTGRLKQVNGSSAMEYTFQAILRTINLQERALGIFQMETFLMDSILKSKRSQAKMRSLQKKKKEFKQRKSLIYCGKQIQRSARVLSLLTQLSNDEEKENR